VIILNAFAFLLIRARVSQLTIGKREIAMRISVVELEPQQLENIYEIYHKNPITSWEGRGSSMGILLWVGIETVN
jgi:hypothetical protein